MIMWHHKLTCKMNLKGQKLRPNMSLYLIYPFSSPRHSSIQPPCHTLTHLLLPTTQSNADVASPLNKATAPPPSPRCDFMCFLLFTISRFIYFNVKYYNIHRITITSNATHHKLYIYILFLSFFPPITNHFR